MKCPPEHLGNTRAPQRSALSERTKSAHETQHDPCHEAWGIRKSTWTNPDNRERMKALPHAVVRKEKLQRACEGAAQGLGLIKDPTRWIARRVWAEFGMVC